MSEEGAVVVLSGGQDSTTCLFWAKQKFPGDIEAITFDYGQRHRIELESAARVASIAEVPHKILPINTFDTLGGNALTGEIEVSSELDSESGLPNTFVPGRNLIFLTFAAAYAYQQRISNLVTGVAQTDYSGYPDCRQETLDSLQRSICLGMEYEIQIHAPLMWLSKKEIVEMAQSAGALEAMAYTHTCYNGEQPPCGDCPSCEIRAKGFAEADIVDPLVTRFHGSKNA